jgi:hypothetical protein
MTLIQLSQLLAAIIGFSACVVWYFSEKRRVRYAPVWLGFWCLLLVAFRLARSAFPVVIELELAKVFNAVANTLFLLGGLGAAIIALTNIVEGKKHGRHS